MHEQTKISTIEKIEVAFKNWINEHPNGGVFVYGDVKLKIMRRNNEQNKRVKTAEAP